MSGRKRIAITDPVTAEQLAADMDVPAELINESLDRAIEHGLIERVAPNRYRLLFMEEAE